MLSNYLLFEGSLKGVWVAPYDRIAKQDKIFQGVFNNALKDQNIRSFIIGYEKGVVVGYAVSFVSGTKIKLGFFIFNSYSKKIKKSIEDIVNIIIESLSNDKKINISKAKKINLVLVAYPDNSLLPIDIKLFKKTTPTITLDL